MAVAVQCSQCESYITLFNSKYVHLETSDEAQSRIEAGAGLSSYSDSCEIP